MRAAVLVMLALAGCHGKGRERNCAMGADKLVAGMKRGAEGGAAEGAAAKALRARIKRAGSAFRAFCVALDDADYGCYDRILHSDSVPAECEGLKLRILAVARAELEK